MSFNYERAEILVQFGLVVMRLSSLRIWHVLHAGNRRIDTPVPDKRHEIWCSLVLTREMSCASRGDKDLKSAILHT